MQQYFTTTSRGLIRHRPLTSTHHRNLNTCQSFPSIVLMLIYFLCLFCTLLHGTLMVHLEFLLQKCSPQWPILKKTACLIFTTIEDWTDSMLTNYLEEGGREIEKKGTCIFCPYGACLVLISQTESGWNVWSIKFFLESAHPQFFCSLWQTISWYILSCNSTQPLHFYLAADATPVLSSGHKKSGALANERAL